MKWNDPRRVIQRFVRRFSAPQNWAQKLTPVVPIPKDIAKASLRLVDRSAWDDKGNMVATLNSAYANRENVHGVMLEFARRYIAACEAQGIPMVFFEGYRSPERQAVLREQRVSNAGPMSSPHQFGVAVDLVHATRLWDYSKREGAILGAIGYEVARKMKIKVMWGGDFKSLYDPSHWQLGEGSDGWKVYREKYLREGPIPYFDWIKESQGLKAYEWHHYLAA